MRRILSRILMLVIVFIFMPLQGFAQSDRQTGAEDRHELNILTDVILKDKFSIQTIAGVLYSPVYKKSRPDLTYAMTDLRFIWGLDPDLTTRKLNWEGNFEFIFELTHSFVFEGAGSVISGVTCLLRYNLPCHTNRLFPYIQAGAGLVYTNSYKDLSQSLIGQALEFNPQFSVGVHYLLKKNWSLDGETMFHHISNAGMNDRNTGVNAIGALLGVTCYF